MCNLYNPSALPATDCYWLMRQWQSRIKQERPFVKEKDISNWCNWLIAKWRHNMTGVEYAVKKLGNSIGAQRTFEEENAELRDAV